jgi:hypothetical protein
MSFQRTTVTVPKDPRSGLHIESLAVSNGLLCRFEGIQRELLGFSRKYHDAQPRSSAAALSPTLTWLATLDPGIVERDFVELGPSDPVADASIFRIPDERTLGNLQFPKDSIVSLHYEVNV